MINQLEIAEYLNARCKFTEDGCHEWQHTTSKGYGRANWGGKRWGAHRLAYMAYKGEIPAGLVVMHICDNPKCCNPEHLTVGTHMENMADSRDKKRGGERWFKGEANPKCVLNDDAVRRIRAMRSQGKLQKEIAKEFNCARTLITHILSGRRWAHVI